MIKLLFTSTVILILSGCATSNLTYKNHQIVLQVDKSSLHVEGTFLKQHKDNFSSLYLTQKVLQLKEGNLVVYEEARTDMLYEFEPSIIRSIQIIFEAKGMVKVYGKSHLYAYQLIMKDGSILNMIAEQSDSQDLSFVYGMSTTQLNKILKGLDPDANPAYYKKVILLKDTSHAILSKWDVKKVHFVPLVVPLPRFSGM